jgi:RNA polymerase sigma-70 factor (ECF subfamily)
VANAAYQKLRSRLSRQRDVPWDEALAGSMFHKQGRHVVPMSAWSPCVDDHPAQQELRAALTCAVDELSSAYRTVLVLRDVQGLSSSETAELLSLSVPAVKTRVHRARLFLRKELVRESTIRQAASTGRPPQETRSAITEIGAP